MGARARTSLESAVACTELAQPAAQLLLLDIVPTLCSEHDPVTRSMKPIRLCSIPGSNSSQSASGSGNSRSRTPRELSWSEAREEGEASEQRVSGGAGLGQQLELLDWKEEKEKQGATV